MGDSTSVHHADIENEDRDIRDTDIKCSTAIKDREVQNMRCNKRLHCNWRPQVCLASQTITPIQAKDVNTYIPWRERDVQQTLIVSQRQQTRLLRQLERRQKSKHRGLERNYQRNEKYASLHDHPRLEHVCHSKRVESEERNFYCVECGELTEFNPCHKYSFYDACPYDYTCDDDDDDYNYGYDSYEQELIDDYYKYMTHPYNYQ